MTNKTRTTKTLSFEYERPLLSQYKAKCSELNLKPGPVLSELLEQFLVHVEGYEQSKSEYTKFTANFDYKQYEMLKGFCKQNDFRMKQIMNTIMREFMTRFQEPEMPELLNDEPTFSGKEIPELTDEEVENLNKVLDTAEGTIGEQPEYTEAEVDEIVDGVVGDMTEEDMELLMEAMDEESNICDCDEDCDCDCD